MLDRVRPFIDKKVSTEAINIDSSLLSDENLTRVLKGLQSTKFNIIPDLVDKALSLFIDPNYESDASKDYLSQIFTPNTILILKSIKEKLEASNNINSETASGLLKEVFEMVRLDVKSLKKPELFHAIRFALTGTKEGPEIPVIMAILGRQRSIERVSKAIQHINESQSDS